MMTEREKMQNGDWYDANSDKELCSLRERAKGLCHTLNLTPPSDHAVLMETQRKLFPNLGKDVTILPPCQTDYECNCFIGDATFINHGAYLMDGARITIGSHCFIGPNLGCYTALHPMDIERRNRGLEKALPITIGNNCWLGGDVKILPGVTIGEGTVIGAGSIVTHDIPDHVVAVGNPCRVLRSIQDHRACASNPLLW